MPLPIHVRDPLGDAGWRDLLHSHPAASVFHTVGWLKALQQTYNYQPLVATTCLPDARLTNGVVFCQVKSFLTGQRLVSLPFSDHCEPLAGSESELELLLGSVPQLIAAAKCKHFELRPLRVAPAAGAGFGPAGAYFMHTINLEASPPQVFQRFHKDSIQRKIQRAEREKLSCEEGASEKLIQEFYRLLLETRRRHRLPPQPLEWFRNLAACMGNGLKLRVAYKDGKPIASIITLQFKKSLVYKYGCSKGSDHRLGGMHMLIWRAIQEGMERGLSLFDFGRCDIENDGLATFKERWGARRTLLAYWNSPSTSNVGRAMWGRAFAGRVFAHLPDPLLAAAGRVLYKQFG